MKKLTLLLLTSLFTGSVVAQTLPEGMTSLLPSGVKAVIDDTRKTMQRKNLVVAGDKANGYKAFFAATDGDGGAHGEELWVTDGTPQGTRMVKDINPGGGSSDVNYLERFNDKVVFGADDGTNGMQLWISDGTEDGTYMVKKIHEFGSADPRGFIQVNETQFVFAAKDFDSENYSTGGEQWWLWVSDGTEDGTDLIQECDMKFPGQDNNTFLHPYCRVGRKVFFKADNIEGEYKGELWVTDGTRAGTQFLKDINTEPIATGTADAAIDYMFNFYNEKLFFKAFSIEHGNEPWASDGTPDGTYMIADTDPTLDETGFPRSGGVFAPGLYDGKVYYRGYTQETGTELAYTNLEEGNSGIFDINQNEPTSENHSHPDPGVEFDGVYMFCAATGFDPLLPNNFGGQLHYTDGETVSMQSNVGEGTNSNWVKELTVVSGSLYWWNESEQEIDKKQKLFRIDSKDEFPKVVTNMYPDGDKIHTLRNLGGDLIFTSNEDNGLYLYHYRKEGYSAEKDADDLEIEYRTRKEIEDDLNSIENIPAATVAVLYPNPATDAFNFDVEGDVLSVKIYDFTGRLVKEENKLISNSVNVSSVVDGIYKVVITTTTGNYVSSLIVK